MVNLNPMPEETDGPDSSIVTGLLLLNSYNDLENWIQISPVGDQGKDAFALVQGGDDDDALVFENAHHRVTIVSLLPIESDLEPDKLEMEPDEKD